MSLGLRGHLTNAEGCLANFTKRERTKRNVKKARLSPPRFTYLHQFVSENRELILEQTISESMNTQDELKDWLKEHGFREHPNPLASFENECKWYACKRYASKYNCECNYDKDGIQIVIWPYRYNLHGHQMRSIEIDLSGEADGVWYKLQGYSMTWDELPDKLDQVTDGLIKAWEAIPRENNNG